MKRTSIPSKSTGLVLTALLLLAACAPKEQKLREKAPRPITTLRLRSETPLGTQTVTGVAKAWKTEKLGFEVAGRVLSVLEPGRQVESRPHDGDHGPRQKGTAIAQLDPTRYQLALESAKAMLEVARLEQESTEIRLKESLPADKKAAEANLALAQLSYDRVHKLEGQEVVSKSEFDRAVNSLQTSKAKLAQVQAEIKRAEAALKASEAQVRKAVQSVKDAQRELDNTTLYAEFRGQISKTHVVPGSLVQAGSPVATIQMMDPIKVEIEVSAELSKTVKRRTHLPVSYKGPDGKNREANAYLYTVASAADPTTRTFTLTLLLFNERIREKLPTSPDGSPVASVQHLWPLDVNRILGVPEDLRYAELQTIRKDEKGPYVLVATNCRMGGQIPELVEVRKERIAIGERVVSLLGTWKFREIRFLRKEANDPGCLLAGNGASGSEIPSNWGGKYMTLDPGPRWNLRPGEIVRVGLDQEALPRGYYVPMTAIYQEAGRSSVFVIDAGKARKVPVELHYPERLREGARVEIRAKELRDGVQIAYAGVHFLLDGESVRVTKTLGSESQKED